MAGCQQCYNPDKRTLCDCVCQWFWSSVQINPKRNALRMVKKCWMWSHLLTWSHYWFNLISVASLICWGEMNTALNSVLPHKDIFLSVLLAASSFFSPQFCLLVCVCVRLCGVCADSIFFLCPHSVCLTYKMQQTVLFVSLLLLLYFSFSLSQYIDLYHNRFLRVYSWHGFSHSPVWVQSTSLNPLYIKPCTPLKNSL